MNTGQTGPKTNEGKARSAQNSFKHGFTMKGLFAAPGEEQTLEALHEGLRAEVRPKGCLEETLFARLLHATWNLHRIKGLEAALFAHGDPFSDPGLGKGLDRLMRYQRLHDRACQTALKEIRIQQTLRMITERIYPAVQIAPGEPIPVTADTAKVQRALARVEATLAKARANPAPQFSSVAEEVAFFAAYADRAAQKHPSAS